MPIRMDKKAKRETILRIDSFYYRIKECCESKGYEWEKYQDLVLAEEKKHRRDYPRKFSLSQAEAVQLIAVRTVLQYAFDLRPVPEIKDYFRVKESCFGALAIALQCRSTIHQEFSKTEAEEAAKWDYAELIQ